MHKCGKLFFSRRRKLQVCSASQLEGSSQNAKEALLAEDAVIKSEDSDRRGVEVDERRFSSWRRKEAYTIFAHLLKERSKLVRS
jgi:hypothetical protein